MAIASLDKVPVENLMMLVIRSVYEGDDTRPGGTEVKSVSDAQVGVPEGGWSCKALINAEGRDWTLNVTFDGERYQDQVADDDEPADNLDSLTDGSVYLDWPDFPPMLRSMVVELSSRGPRVYPLSPVCVAMASELASRGAIVALDAEPTDEELVLLAVRAIYEQSNWKVIGISNLVVGDPEGGLTVEIDIRNPDTNARLKLRGVYADGVFEDQLISEIKGDVDLEDEGFGENGLREDAAKGKGKRKPRSGPPKCNKGRPCGNSCVRMKKANGDDTTCKNEPQGVVKEALEKVAAKGKARTAQPVTGGSGQGRYVIPPEEDAVKRFKLIGEGLTGMVYLDAPNNVVIKYRKGAVTGRAGQLSAQVNQQEADIQRRAAGLGVAPKVAGQADFAIAMEYLKGYKPIMDKKATARLSLEKQKTVSTNIINSLRSLNNAGIQHNDFHDLNVLFNPRTLDVKVIDYGMSRDKGNIDFGTDFARVSLYMAENLKPLARENVRQAIANAMNTYSAAANNYDDSLAQKIIDEINKA